MPNLNAGLDKRIEGCKKGKHRFQEIKRVETNHTNGMDTVLEWCSVCGVIREKIEFDGRYPTQLWYKVPQILDKLKTPK